MLDRPQNSSRGRKGGQPQHIGRAKSLRSRSNYLPGSAYKPSKEQLGRRQAQVLEVLKKAGLGGILTLDVPRHLLLGWSARVCELRKMGYPIDSKLERVGDVPYARYVLRSSVPDASGHAGDQ